MNIIIFIFFIMFVYISYIVGNRDILSPWFILCFMFFFCLIVTLVNVYNWDTHYSFEGIWCLIIGIGSWGIGSIVAKKIQLKEKNITLKMSTRKISIKKYPTITVMLVSNILTIIYIYKMTQFAGTINILKNLRIVYDKTITGASIGFIGNQVFIILQVLAYISIYILLKKKRCKKIFVLVPILEYCICMIISTDRNTFIRCFIYTFCIFILLYRPTQKSNINFKIVKKAIPFISLGIVAFFLLGKSKNYQSNFGRAISIYTGSGLYAFTLFVQQFNTTEMTYGFSTFYTIFGVFQKIGIPFKELSGYRFEKFIEYASTNGYYFSTNVYTALKRYFEDFGMWGIVFIPLISGFCYDIFYRYINKSEKDLSKIFYAMLIYPIIYYPIMEQMFTRMHLGTVYEIMWMYVLFNILCKNSIIEENNKL